ncbi:MAG: hypothetical protein WCJ09_16290 [Planctomycetota bacterium]
MITFILAFPIMIMFLLAGAACGFFVMHHKLTTIRLSERPAFKPTGIGELGWFMAPVLVATTFAAIQFLDFTQVLGIDRLQSNAGLSKSLFRNRDSIEPIHAQTSDQPRPAWIDKPEIHDGLSEQHVISSQQFSTREEAEQELLKQANQILQDDLAKLFPGESAVSPWNPTLETLKQHAVKQQYAEVVDRDFGSFVHPMYRVWWQVELSPEVRVEFLPMWRKGITSARIRLVAVVTTSVALVISLMAFYYRASLLRGGTVVLRLWLLPFIGLAAMIVIKWFRSF